MNTHLAVFDIYKIDMILFLCKVNIFSFLFSLKFISQMSGDYWVFFGRMRLKGNCENTKTAWPEDSTTENAIYADYYRFSQNYLKNTFGI